MATTYKNITVDQCEALAREAAQAGDLKLVGIAKDAAEALSCPLSRRERDTWGGSCIRRCADIIAVAEAQS